MTDALRKITGHMNMAQFRETNLTMTFANEGNSAEDAIKAELEQVYVMASYVDAGRGRLEIVKHLVSAAIAEMESLVEKPIRRRSPPIRLVGAGRIKHDARHK